MKRIATVFTSLMILVLMSGHSQNRSINFIEKSWAEITGMAKSENKMIFLDAYTTWCGPCKWMAANIFTNDSVADFFNKSFINAHFDMEKGEGMELARLFQVKAYPTLLFINSDGEVLHVRVGAPRNVKDYLDMGAIALTPGEGLNSYLKRFQEGNRDPEFIMKYIERLQGAYLPIDEALSQYFATQPESALNSRENWKIIFEHVSDMDSREFQYLLAHRAEYEKLYTRDSVNSKIYFVFVQSLTSVGRSRTFSEETYSQIKQKIRTSGFAEADKAIFTGDMNLYQIKGDMEKFIALATSGLTKYYGDDYVMLNRVAWHFFQVAQDTKDLEKAAGWAKQSVRLNSMAENNNTYANLLYKLGNKKEAVETASKALDLAIKEQLPLEMYEENLKRFSD